jgi:hypothetical protein
VEDTVGQPCDGSDHSEPAQSAHDPTDFLILSKQSPLAEKNFPVMLAGTNQRQSLGARVRHVGANIGEIFKEPEAAKSGAGGFPLPEEIECAQERNKQFAKRSTENHDGVAEPTEEKMPALVDDQINVIEKEKTAAVEGGVKKEESIEAEPADSRETGDRLPCAEAIFEKRHRRKRNNSDKVAKELRTWLLPKTSCRRCLPTP